MFMNQTPKKTEAELKKFWEEHLTYEFDMLCWTERAIDSCLFTGWQQYAFLESFLIHVRNLNDFFYPVADKTQPDDVTALTFCNHWNPNPSTILTGQLIKRIHKELAHLTWKRKSDPKDKEWDFKSIANEFRRLMQEFEINVQLRTHDWRPISTSSPSPGKSSKDSGLVTYTGVTSFQMTATGTTVTDPSSKSVR